EGGRGRGGRAPTNTPPDRGRQTTGAVHEARRLFDGGELAAARCRRSSSTRPGTRRPAHHHHGGEPAQLEAP
ncbi:hypothetical protein, partial [Streptomyces sp. NPDC057199]|uniref:hypothetical protein n=1 Tax=Streptomyces sp. NPDC057199 TaxID=3346047 RepID=UPI00362E7EBC